MIDTLEKPHDMQSRIATGPLRIGILGRAEMLVCRAAIEPGRWVSPGTMAEGVCLHLHLVDGVACEARDGTGQLARSNVRAGEVIAFDLGEALQVRYAGAVDPIVVVIPGGAITAVAEELNAASTGRFDFVPGRPFEDEHIRSLVTLLLSEGPDGSRCGQFFLGQIALALLVRVATSYGGIVELSRLPKGGLAPWQTRRAKDMMDARLDSSLSLAEVAGACGLSLSHFSRAFRRTVGMAPHAWLTHRRVEAAKARMRDMRMPLAEIALACGFADQSHFTRVFSRETGTSPGAWRRCLVA